MKRTIEIDVPDGYEPVITTFNDIYGNPYTTLINYKKKEPAFIEVRDYLTDRYGEKNIFCHIKGSCPTDHVEKTSTFVKWLGDWRKVEI